MAINILIFVIFIYFPLLINSFYFRVIFLECDLNICKERIANRRINMYTGSTVDITKLTENDIIDELKIHPRDSAAMADAEVSQ